MLIETASGGLKEESEGKKERGRHFLKKLTLGREGRRPRAQLFSINKCLNLGGGGREEGGGKGRNS